MFEECTVVIDEDGLKYIANDQDKYWCPCWLQC